MPPQRSKLRVTLEHYGPAGLLSGVVSVLTVWLTNVPIPSDASSAELRGEVVHLRESQALIREEQREQRVRLEELGAQVGEIKGELRRIVNGDPPQEPTYVRGAKTEPAKRTEGG